MGLTARSVGHSRITWNRDRVRLGFHGTSLRAGNLVPLGKMANPTPTLSNADKDKLVTERLK